MLGILKAPDMYAAGFRKLTDRSIHRRRAFDEQAYTPNLPILTLSLLRLLDSNFPEHSLWAWQFHPSKLRLCLSQTL